MMHRLALPLAFSLALAASLGACSGQNSHSTATVFSGVDPAEASGDNWLDYDGPGAAHYSPLADIDTGNVDDLGLAGFYDIDVPGSSLTNPVAVDGVLYFAAGLSVVHAIDPLTGKLLWQYDPQVGEAAGDKLKVGWGSRGIAYAKGQIFVGTMDGRLIALDAKTGELAWSVLTTQPGDNRYITGAPWVYGDKVVIGHGGADFSPTRGYVTAYDQNSGKQAWRFYTVPGNPADGFENEAMEMAAKTWNGEWWKFGGGATVWNAMAYDPELNRIYIGTGNGAPWNRKIRSPDGGDNLFVCSIVALDADTGEYIWHYQTNPGETWDFNSDMDIELADMDIDGKRRKVILHAPKNGFFYVIDRTDGKLISAENFVPTNWASAIDPKTGRPVENPAARFPDGKAAIVYPSPYGAHNIEAMSFSPQSGLVYIPAMDQGRTYIDPPEMDKFRQTAEPIIANNGVGSPPADVKPDEPKSFLLAWDPVAQKEVWRAPYQGNRGGGGALATAGALVFQGRATGEFKAYEAQSGKVVWSFDAQSAVMTNPISYRVKGKQYISVVVGSRFGSAYGLDREWDYHTQHWRVLTFALGGTAKLPANDLTPTPFEAHSGFVIDPVKAAAGSALYHQTCVLCHGGNAASGGSAPDLRRSAIPGDFATFKAIVHDGALVSRAMPKFDDLSDAQLQSLQHFLVQRGRESAAGQPPTKKVQDEGQ